MATSGVAQDDGTDACHEGCLTNCICKNYAMIRGIGLGKGGKLVGVGLPVEFSTVHDDTSEARSVASEELRGRVDHDVGAVLQGPDQIRCAEGVVHYQGDAVPVGHFCHALNVEHVAVGIAEGLGYDGLCVGLDG